MKSKRKSTFEVGVRVPQRPEEPAARLIPVGANFTFRPGCEWPHIHDASRHGREGTGTRIHATERLSQLRK
jgi:hypothetical protein